MKKDMRASAAPVALNPAAMADERSAVAVAFEAVRSSFDKFCLIAGIEALQELLQEEASAVCGERHQRHDGRQGGARPGARSPFMGVGSGWTARGFAAVRASRNWCCRVGRRRRMRTGSASGR
jgi:hypothetical protein